MSFSIHQDLMRSGKHVSRLDKQDTEHPLLSRVLPDRNNKQTESNFGTDLRSSQIRPDCGPELNWAAELREAHSLKSPNNLANTEHWKALLGKIQCWIYSTNKKNNIYIHTDLNLNIFPIFFSQLNL